MQTKLDKMLHHKVCFLIDSHLHEIWNKFSCPEVDGMTPDSSVSREKYWPMSRMSASLPSGQSRSPGWNVRNARVLRLFLKLNVPGCVHSQTHTERRTMQSDTLDWLLTTGGPPNPQTPSLHQHWAFTWSHGFHSSALLTLHIYHKKLISEELLYSTNVNKPELVLGKMPKILPTILKMFWLDELKPL